MVVSTVSTTGFLRALTSFLRFFGFTVFQTKMNYITRKCRWKLRDDMSRLSSSFFEQCDKTFKKAKKKKKKQSNKKDAEEIVRFFF